MCLNAVHGARHVASLAGAARHVALVLVCALSIEPFEATLSPSALFTRLEHVAEPSLCQLLLSWGAVDAVQAATRFSRLPQPTKLQMGHSPAAGSLLQVGNLSQQPVLRALLWNVSCLQ